MRGQGVLVLVGEEALLTEEGGCAFTRRSEWLQPVGRVGKSGCSKVPEDADLPCLLLHPHQQVSLSAFHDLSVSSLFRLLPTVGPWE